ncbi:MAG: hypothetical protein ACI8UO_005476 [Verrucomicrobiales bacterium]|jgi:hypothetical protein
MLAFSMDLFGPSMLALSAVAVVGFTAGLLGGWSRWRNERSRIQQLLDENTAMCREIDQLQSRGPAAIKPAGESESPLQSSG